VINPAQVNSYAKSLGQRTKTDKKDSMVLARYGSTQSPELWHPEPEEVRTLKAMIARIDAVDQDIQREKNRLEKAEIGQVSQAVLTSIHNVLSPLKQEKARLEILIDQHIDQHPILKRDRRLLESIPGVGPVISRIMLAVTQSNVYFSVTMRGLSRTQPYSI
jgi:transposase